LSPDSRPRLPRHARLRFDSARDTWVMLGPERVFTLDGTAADILKRCTGDTTLAELIAALAADYGADPAEVGPDVRELLGDLVDKGMVTP